MGTPAEDDDGQLVDVRERKKRNDIMGRLFSHPKIDALRAIFHQHTSSKMMTGKRKKIIIPYSLLYTLF